MLFTYCVFEVLFGPVTDRALFIGHGSFALVSLLVHLNEVLGRQYSIMMRVVNIEVGVLLLLAANHFRRAIRHSLKRLV